VLADSEVASYYVQYGRGTIRALPFFFAVLLFCFAWIAAAGWKDWSDAVISIAIGLALVVVGVGLHLPMADKRRVNAQGSDEPEEPGTHRPD